MQIGNAIKIISQDKTEWTRYMAEENERGGLMSYAIILIVISNVAKAIGALVFTAGFAMMGGWAMYGLALHGLTLVLEIAALYLIPMILSKIAPSFSGQSNDMNAFKLYVYCMTPAWVGAILGIIPFLGWIGALAGGIFAIYLFWQHAGDAMGVPEDKKIGYVLVSALCIVVLYAIIGAIVGAIVSMLFVGGLYSTGMHRGWGM